MDSNAESAPPSVAYWAKLGRSAGNDACFHPLLCHMIDVAVVARAMWRDVLSAAARDRLGDALGLPADMAESWVAFLAGLHDLGKACPVFQLRREAAVLRALYAGLPAAPPG